MDFRTNDLFCSDRTFRSKHGTVATMNTAGTGRPLASLTLGHRGLTKHRMSTDFGFDNPKTLLSWAAANHVELCTIEAVLADETPRLVIDEHPVTALRVYKLVLDGFSADRTARLVHEGILHARHALDQAMVAAWATLETGEEAPHTLYFPITADDAQLQGKMVSTRDPLGKFGPAMKRLLTEIQPYKITPPDTRGHPLLVVLSQAARTKHQLVAKLRIRVNGATFSNWCLTNTSGFENVWSDDHEGLVMTRCGREGIVHAGETVFDQVQLEVSGLGRLDGGPITDNLGDAIAVAKSVVHSIEEAALYDAAQGTHAAASVPAAP